MEGTCLDACKPGQFLGEIVGALGGVDGGMEGIILSAFHDLRCV